MNFSLLRDLYCQILLFILFLPNKCFQVYRVNFSKQPLLIRPQQGLNYNMAIHRLLGRTWGKSFEKMFSVIFFIKRNYVRIF